MYAYKEIITLDDPQNITLNKPLKLAIGKKIELIIIAEDDTDELNEIRSQIQQQGITGEDVKKAIDWSRE